MDRIKIKIKLKIRQRLKEQTPKNKWDTEKYITRKLIVQKLKHPEQSIEIDNAIKKEIIPKLKNFFSVVSKEYDILEYLLDKKEENTQDNCKNKISNQIENAIEQISMAGKYEIDSKIGQDRNEYNLIQTSKFEVTDEDANDLEIIQGYRKQLLETFENKEIWEIRKNNEIIWEKPKEQKTTKRTLIIDNQCMNNYTNGGVHYYTEDGRRYY